MKRAALLALGLLLALPAWADNGGQLLQLLGGILSAAGMPYFGYALYVAGGLWNNNEQRKKQRRIAAEQRAKYNEGLSDRSVTVLRADPPWQVIYGRAIVGGFVADIFASDKTYTQPDGTSATKADGYKHLTIVFACHRVQAINEIYIDGVAVGTLDGSGYPTGGEFLRARTDTRMGVIGGGGTLVTSEQVTAILGAKTVTGSGENATYTDVTGSTSYSGSGPYTISGPAGAEVTYSVSVPLAAVRITKHLGTDTEAVDSVFAAINPTRYTAAHGMKGLAGIGITLDLEDPRFIGGLPNITADVSGALVYDPRKDSTVAGGSGAHRVATPSTWEYSENNALCIRDFLTQPYGLRVDADEVNVERLIASANACDVAISLTVGATTTTGQPQYTCNGAFRTDSDKEAVLQDLEESMAGIVTYGADWQIIAGTWTTPVMTLTDADLAGALELVQADTPLENLFNGLHGQYIPRGAQGPVDFNPPYQNATFVTADGSELWQNVELPFTDNAARARNIARILTERNRLGQVIRYPAKLRAWGLQVGDRVTVTSTEFGITAQTYRVTDWQFDVPGIVLLTLQRDVSATWDLADAASAEPAPNTDLPNPATVPAISGLAAASGSANAVRNADGVVSPRVKVTWTAVTDPYVLSGGHIEVMRFRYGTGVRMPIKEPDLPPNASSTFLGNVGDGEPLLITVQAVNRFGHKGQPVTVAHTVSGGTTAIDTPNIADGAAAVIATSDQGGGSQTVYLTSTDILTASLDCKGYPLLISATVSAEGSLSARDVTFALVWDGATQLTRTFTPVGDSNQPGNPWSMFGTLLQFVVASPGSGSKTAKLVATGSHAVDAVNVSKCNLYCEAKKK